LDIPLKTLSLGFDILHKYKGVNSIIISNILLSSGARACKALNHLEEAIKWCDEGFEVSFDNVLPDIPSILWLNNFRLMCRGREGGREEESIDKTTGGAMASWLVRSSPNRAVRVRALAGDIVLCSWARHFTLTVPLSAQVYK